MPKAQKGTCFCGAVEFEVTGEPMGMGYCHCPDCRAWTAAPVHAWSVWGPDAVQVTKGEDHLKTFSKSEFSDRKFCDNCGSGVMVYHPPLGVFDIPVANVAELKFEPQVHVHYIHTVLPMRDGLPKMKDFPSEFGGSGETVPE